VLCDGGVAASMKKYVRDDPYAFWFSTTSKAQAGKAHQPYFERSRSMLARRRRSNGRLTLHFNEQAGTVLLI
jgi:hypothetical protein